MNTARAALLLRIARGGVLLLFAVFVVGSVVRSPASRQWPLDLVVYNAVLLLVASSCLLRLHDARGVVQAWRAVAAALVVIVVGNVCFTVPGADPRLGWLNLSDALYLTSYLFVYPAVVLLVRARSRTFLPSMWLDGLVTGLGVAAAISGYLVGPLLEETGGTLTELAATMTYPLADLFLLVLMVSAFALLGGRVDLVQLVAAASLLLVIVGDVLYGVQDAVGSYAEGGLTDVISLAGIAILAFAPGAEPPRERTAALAALPQPRHGGEPHPAAATRSNATNWTQARVGWSVLALPGLASIGCVLMLGVDRFGRFAQPSRALAAACLLAALTRVILTFREVRDLGDVHRQARTDELTGLPNRRAFYEQCEEALARKAGAPPRAALLLLDVDRFKEINDDLGHAAGDDLLVQIGQRFSGVLHPSDVLARLGGDEFALLLPGAGELRALRVAAQLRELLSDTFTLDAEPVHVDVSVGVACAPEAGHTRSELLRCADVAMYQAKTAHSFVRAYTAVGASDGGQRLRTVEDLRQVLAGDHTRGGRLIVYLQPQARLASGRVVGAEALIRWAHPVRGLLPPAAFLSVAETAGLMGRITDVALDQALTACRQWWDDGHHLPVSVNVTASSVHDNTLPVTVSAALDRHGLPPRALVIELTEDTLMTDPPTARRVLDSVRRLGVGVSIDDYGTGYSSLAYLRNLAVDELKIDRAFTSGVADDPAAAAIVRHTADLAHALGLRLVAEGVEDQMTMQILTALGCDLAQGFQIAQPMPARAFLSWLGQQAEDALPPQPGRAASRQEAAN